MLRIWAKPRESTEYKNHSICDPDIPEIKLATRDIERLSLYYSSKYRKNMEKMLKYEDFH